MTLRDYIVNRMAQAGLTPDQLSNVMWWDDEWKRWRTFGVSPGEPFRVASEIVDVTEIPDSVRGRVIFSVTDNMGNESVFKWDATQGHFVQGTIDDRNYPFTADHLRGTA